MRRHYRPNGCWCLIDDAVGIHTRFNAGYDVEELADDVAFAAFSMVNDHEGRLELVLLLGGWIVGRVRGGEHTHTHTHTHIHIHTHTHTHRHTLTHTDTYTSITMNFGVN